MTLFILRASTLLTLILALHVSAFAEGLQQTIKAPGVTIELSASSKSFTTTETLKLHVSVELEQGAVIIEDLDLLSLEDWFLLRKDFQRPTLMSHGGKRWQGTLFLVPVKVGQASLKGLTFRVRPLAQSSFVNLEAKDISFSVKSLLPANHSLDKIKDIAELTPQTERVTESETFNGWFFAVLFCTAVTLVICWKWSTNQSVKTTQKSVPEALVDFEQRAASLDQFIAYRELMRLLRTVLSMEEEGPSRSMSRADIDAVIASLSLPDDLRIELEAFLKRYELVVFAGQGENIGHSEQLRSYIKIVKKLATIREQR